MGRIEKKLQLQASIYGFSCYHIELKILREQPFEQDDLTQLKQSNDQAFLHVYGVSSAQ